MFTLVFLSVPVNIKCSLLVVTSAGYVQMLRFDLLIERNQK